MWRKVPNDGKPDLESRFKSSDDRHHLAAFLEIYIAYLLKRLGYCVSTHPSLQGTERRPDFRARRMLASDIILEATTASHQSLEQEAATKRANVVYDIINTMKSPDFWLHLSVEGAPQTPPKASRLRSSLHAWLRGLSCAQVSNLLDSGDTAKLPTFHYEHEGWSIDFKAWPKSLQRSGAPGIRPIGVQVGSFERSNATGAIRDSALNKASAYGSLPLPYVIVGEGDIDAARALLEEVESAEMFLYPGDQHLFADSSLSSYDAEATALVMERVLDFLASR
ncbi:MAG: hypothetical protein WBR18_10925 [Anaerolineales bacterium]